MLDFPKHEAPFSRPPAPWVGRSGLLPVLTRWRAEDAFVLSEDRDAKGSDEVPLPSGLPAELVRALGARGIARLYRHQAEAFEFARLDRPAGPRHVVVATPTASGKSLCYNLPVLDALARDPDARALYLFPTKALSRDQEEALASMLREAGLAHGAITYDGDTPADARRAARNRAGVLLSNPDMVHAGILPHHAAWARFFANLRYVVIDELHTYRGVFGSHLANVVRRLVRIARFHGSDPVFLFASATIGNPADHASRILGEPVELIDQNGAPQGARHVFVYNPPVVNRELGVRESYIKAAVRLTAQLVEAGVPTLLFGRSRNSVETMLKYLRDRLSAERIGAELIQAYRGGYLANTRRRIERGLRSGAVKCVVATSALELGIDIGSLQAVVCAGYPGSMASLWQRFGRGGRRDEASVSVLVASSLPVDQYVAQNSRLVVEAPVEHARIDPDNAEILVSHLRCASFELPFEEGESFGTVDAEPVGDALDFLESHRVVHSTSSTSGKRVWHWSTDAYPANHVSLRSVGWDNFVIIDLHNDRTLAEMDWRSTHTMLHVQAIYQHDGEQYQVERLDYENHKAYVRRVKPDYYTDAMTYTLVSVLAEDDSATVRVDDPDVISAGVGDVSVISKVVGYKKIKFHTHENVGYGDVRLPEMQMHTTGFWITFPESWVRRQVGRVELVHTRAQLIDALRGIANALHLVATIGLMIDGRDLGQTLGDTRDQSGEGGGPGFDPTIFLYDAVPSGVGLAPRIFADRSTLLGRAYERIYDCECDTGCPACIGPDPNPSDEKKKRDRRRDRALKVLESLHVCAARSVA